MLGTISRHAAGFFLFLFVFVAATAFTGFGNDAAFDSNVWLRSDARDRGRMAQDLVDGQTLIGRPAESVHETLGLPEKNYGTVYQYKIDLGWPMKDPKHYGLQVHLDADRDVSLVKIVD